MCRLLPMFHAYFRRTIVVALLSVIMLPARAEEVPLLSASAETSSPGETRPSPPLVSIVLKAVDKSDLEHLDDCIADQGLKQGDDASLLRAVRIDSGAARNLWFVRPALDPFCVALYGAHSFQYFLIEEQLSFSPPRIAFSFRTTATTLPFIPRKATA